MRIITLRNTAHMDDHDDQNVEGKQRKTRGKRKRLDSR